MVYHLEQRTAFTGMDNALWFISAVKIMGFISTYNALPSIRTEKSGRLMESSENYFKTINPHNCNKPSINADDILTRHCRNVIRGK